MTNSRTPAHEYNIVPRRMNIIIILYIQTPIIYRRLQSTIFNSLNSVSLRRKKQKKPYFKTMHTIIMIHPVITPVILLYCEFSVYDFLNARVNSFLKTC